MSQKLQRFVKGLVAAGSCVALLAGCNLQGPTGPAGPALSGTLSGFVALINADGGEPVNRSGVVVSIDGMSQSATTDSTGMWSIANLTTGIYTLTYSKAGYADTKSIQVQFVGGGARNIGVVNMCEPPAFGVDSVWTRMPKGGDSNSVYLGVLANNSITGPYKVILFFGNAQNVSWKPSTYQTASAENMLFKAGLDSSSIRLQPINLATDGYSFDSGDTVYAAVYMATAGTTNSSYTDLATGKTVYTDIDTSSAKVIQFVVP